MKCSNISNEKEIFTKYKTVWYDMVNIKSHHEKD